MSLEASRWHAGAGLRGAPRAKAQLIGAREWIRLAVLIGAVLVDFVLIFLGCLTGSVARFGSMLGGNALGLMAAVAPAYLVGCGILHAYRIAVLRHGFKSAVRAAMALAIAVSLGLAAAFALQVSAHASRLETGVALLAAGLYLVLGRSLGAVLIRSLRTVIDPVAVFVGDSSIARFGGAVGGYIDIHARGWSPRTDDPRLLTEIFEAVRHSDRILLVLSDAEERRQWAQMMRLTGVDAEIIDPALSDSSPIAIASWEGVPTLVISRGPLSLGERVLKRALDLTLVLTLAPLVIPLTAILAVLICVESPGPALFVQERVGRNNRRYKCYKLRTMQSGALDYSGDQSTARDDHRITRIGHSLRRTSLDELPQLWNVLIGNMSLVGPRPHALGSTAGGALFWEVVDGYWSRHSVKPGITGLAQTRGLRGATSSREDLEMRVASDLEYINHWSIWLDLKLILKTLGVITHRNAF